MVTLCRKRPLWDLAALPLHCSIGATHEVVHYLLRTIKSDCLVKLPQRWMGGSVDFIGAYKQPADSFQIQPRPRIVTQPGDRHPGHRENGSTPASGHLGHLRHMAGQHVIVSGQVGALIASAVTLAVSTARVN